MKKVLEVKDLCKTYMMNKKETNILKNVSFSVEEGEMVSIMGPSGSGKSTLLYTISGMDEVTSGMIRFAGKELNTLSATEMSDIRLNEMGFIFQQMYMLKNLTIFDNIILPAFQSKKVKGKVARMEKQEYAQNLMRKMGITEIAENDINEVSGGQLQRACVCRSLINSPKVIFADEPTGALNKQATNDVMKEIGHANQEGTTVVLVTHDAKVAAKSDRVVYLVDGEIVGDYTLGKYLDEATLMEREKRLNNWLLEKGW
jgi:putative ABC transport system ATP-binding protein